MDGAMGNEGEQGLLARKDQFDILAWKQRQGPLVKTHNLEIGLNFEDTSDHRQRTHLDFPNPTAESVETVS